MKRMRVLREGIPTEDGRMIPPGGVTWEEPVPIYSADGRLVGTLDSLRREANGWVTGRVNGVVVVKGWALQAELRGVETEDVESLTGNLGRVVVGDRPAWPGMRV